MPNAAGINGAGLNGSARPLSVPAEYPSRSAYTCVLTGSPDLPLPIASFQARWNDDSPTFLSVNVPGAVDLEEEIEARAGGQIVLTRTTYSASGSVLSTGEVLRVDLENIRIDAGPRSWTASLDGHRTTVNGAPKSVTLTGASYRSVTNGIRRYRCRPNNAMRPGDTAIIGEDSFVVDSIAWYVSTGGETYELSEAEPNG